MAEVNTPSTLEGLFKEQYPSSTKKRPLTVKKKLNNLYRKILKKKKQYGP